MDMVDPEKTQCNCCGVLKIKDAPICHHCGRNQNKIYRFFSTPTPQWLALILSIILLVLSWRQLTEATIKRESAEGAFLKADDAYKKSEAASNKAEAAERSVINIANATISHFESLFEKTGRADGGYSPEEREKRIRILKDALPRK
jgi:hypothetical protein